MMFRISPEIQSIAGIAYSKTHADTKKQELLLFENVVTTCMYAPTKKWIVYSI